MGNLDNYTHPQGDAAEDLVPEPQPGSPGRKDRSFYDKFQGRFVNALDREVSHPYICRMYDLSVTPIRTRIIIWIRISQTCFGVNP